MNFLKLNLIFVLLLSVMPFVFAVTTYNNTGQNSFALGTGIFSSQISANSYIKGMSDAKQIPLVTDLDNDGINEIIALDGTTVNIYQGKELAVIDSYALSLGTQSNMITYDIDGDGLREIVIGSEDNNSINIISFSNSTLSLKNSIDLSGIVARGFFYSPEFLINCRDANDCLLADTYSKGDIGNVRVYVQAFNSTALMSNSTAILSIGGFNLECFSNIRTMEVKDYDRDSIKEFIFTVGMEGDTDRVYTLFVNSNKTTVNLENSVYETIPQADLTLRQCNSPLNIFSRTFTSPTVDDFQTGGGMETIIARMVNTNEFKIDAIKSNMDVTHHPTILNADGMILSNPFKANAFPVAKSGNKENDFCVMGYRDDIGLLDLTCSSYESSYKSNHDIEYFANNTGVNLTDDYIFYNHAVHSVEELDESLNGNNQNEILTPYGIFKLTLGNYYGFPTYSCTGISGLNDCIMEQIYQMPQSDAAVISIDYEKTGKEDLIAMTKNDITYIDDVFTNSAPEISYYRINPCIDQGAWKVNTSVQVTMKATDANNDMVSYQIILYYGTPDEITASTVNITQATTASLSLTANITTPSSILRLKAADIYGNLAYKDFSYSVASDGVVLNDCFTEQTIVTGQNVTTPQYIPNTNININPSASNAVYQGIGFFSSFTGLGAMLTWFLLIILFDLWVIFNKTARGFHNDNLRMLVPIIIIIDIFAVVAGVILAIIPVGIIITLAVLAIFAFAYYFYSKFQSSNG